MRFFPARPKPLVLSLVLFGLLLTVSHAGAVTQQPATSVSTDLQRGIDLYRSGETKSAIQVLGQLTKRDKTNGEGWYYLGLALTRINQIDKARKAFDNTTRLLPDFGPGHTAYSYALLLTGRTADADKEARRALELDNNLAEAHYVLGVVHLRGKKYEEAVAEADLATKYKPVFTNAVLLKYQALLAQYVGRAMTPARVQDPNEDLEEKQKAREISREILKQAIAALEMYIDESPANQTEIWRQQLETMRLFATGRSDVISSRDVTTRARVLGKPEPSYTSEAKEAGITGTVVLGAVFTSEGKVENIWVMASLPYGLTEAAVAAARKITFVPATKNGKPVSMFMQLEYNFNLY